MNISARQNQVTVCMDNICLTVVGEFAKALAVVAIIGLAVLTAGQIAKLLK